MDFALLFRQCYVSTNVAWSECFPIKNTQVSRVPMHVPTESEEFLYHSEISLNVSFILSYIFHPQVRFNLNWSWRLVDTMGTGYSQVISDEV